MQKLKTEHLGRDTIDIFHAKEKTPIVLVLDNIRSGLNVGSIFRTADAFALEKIYLCGITVQPPHREILKTAIGATDSIAWKYFNDVKLCAGELNAKGYTLIGVEQTTHSQSLHQFELPELPIALFLGNEVHGISESILPLLDASLVIPQFGTKHSFNVSVCAGIVIWDLFCKWKWTGDKPRTISGQ